MRVTVACAECGHLHYTSQGYVPCPIEDCPCPMFVPRETTWGRIERGAWIICPVSGLPEQVTRIAPYRAGRIFVRTTQHDHIRPRTAPVTVTEGTL